MASKTVLDLDNLDDFPTIVINRKHYRIWSVDRLPPLDGHRVRKLLKRNDELSKKDDLTTKEVAELKRIFDEIARTVLDAPDSIHAKLNDKQRADIINVFQVPSLDLLMRWAEMATAIPAASAAPSTGSPSPTDSPASTQP